jgi:hypothetical protein
MQVQRDLHQNVIVGSVLLTVLSVFLSLSFVSSFLLTDVFRQSSAHWGEALQLFPLTVSWLADS